MIGEHSIDMGLPLEEFLLVTLHSFLENSPDLIFVKDINLRYIAASRVFANMAGYASGDELSGKSDYEIFDRKLAEQYTIDDKYVLESGVPIIDHMEPLPDMKGRKRYSSTSKYLIRDGDGTVIGIYGVGRDVTDRIELEEEREYRRQSDKMFEDVLEADLTQNQMITSEGSPWIAQLSLKTHGSFSDTVKVLATDYIHRNYADEFLSLYDIGQLKEDYAAGKREFTHLTYQSDNGKDYRWIEYRTRLYASRVSNTLRITSFLKDKSDEIHHQNRLIKKAETDTLTGLRNRSSVISHINRCLSEEGRDKNHALLFIDLDNFKQVNDRFGHPFGDEVLCAAANRLKGLFRGNDFLSRVGGDEFLVFMKYIRSLEDVEKRARQIVNLMSFQHPKGDNEIHVTCSVGISLYKGDGKTLEQLYEEADKAMYKAKEQGRNQIAFYDRITFERT